MTMHVAGDGLLKIRQMSVRDTFSFKSQQKRQTRELRDLTASGSARVSETGAFKTAQETMFPPYSLPSGLPPELAEHARHARQPQQR